ncbi:MAG: bifunctional 4-hydroxy-2-oxoglutarate aldolase/2-dehydro-3-deoxy-phosphogluconate aldolase [Lentisphaerae bacterium]|nr:MAG: bifunctional 4-hydroxy-2-oxoglutarate aldolase/2-dehydro-3-deoxy-phosphogluconate aldolase [Lentisphaerota bacterium]
MFPNDLLNQLARYRVAATFSVDDPTLAVPLVNALHRGGIRILEMTLRTPAALDAINRVCHECKDVIVGAGTILTPEQVAEVKAAGAAFGVAPGLNPEVVAAARDVGLPFAPGIATPSELEKALNLGCRLVKFFPAEACGGTRYLRSMAAPYRHLGVRYFPLGGINEKNMLDYLHMDDVLLIGGSWIVEKTMVRQRDWAALEQRARSVSEALESLKTGNE